jgi:hypothetical protein
MRGILRLFWLNVFLLSIIISLSPVLVAGNCFAGGGGSGWCDGADIVCCLMSGNGMCGDQLHCESSCGGTWWSGSDGCSCCGGGGPGGCSDQGESCNVLTCCNPSTMNCIGSAGDKHCCPSGWTWDSVTLMCVGACDCAPRSAGWYNPDFWGGCAEFTDNGCGPTGTAYAYCDGCYWNTDWSPYVPWANAATSGHKCKANNPFVCSAGATQCSGDIRQQCAANRCSWTNIENCNNRDGWVDTGNTQWVSTGPCTQRQDKEQNWMDYSCSAGSCTPTVTSTQWVPNGIIGNKNDGIICATESGGCEADDTCQAGVCTEGYALATTICNPSAGVCDVAEYCTGSSPTCPGDSFAPSSTTCTGSNNGGLCDTTDYCSGTANTCIDKYLSGTVCRASTGICDQAETCTGSSSTCPGDSSALITTLCNGNFQCSSGAGNGKYNDGGTYPCQGYCDGNGNRNRADNCGVSCGSGSCSDTGNSFTLKESITVSGGCA